MRISDWSSDVCSSDLLDAPARTRHRRFFSVATRSRDSLRLRRFFHRLQALKMLVDGLAIRLVVVALSIGRASCRERVCQYVSIFGVSLSLKKHNTITNDTIFIYDAYYNI